MENKEAREGSVSTISLYEALSFLPGVIKITPGVFPPFLDDTLFVEY
jgi:hypothetical protein